MVRYFTYLIYLLEGSYTDDYSFSVTKWIHLNWGDEGIKKFFQIVADYLKPSGFFILEPQQWRSYKKKRTLTEVRAVHVII